MVRAENPDGNVLFKKAESRSSLVAQWVKDSVLSVTAVAGVQSRAPELPHAVGLVKTNKQTNTNQKTSNQPTNQKQARMEGLIKGKIERTNLGISSLNETCESTQ